VSVNSLEVVFPIADGFRALYAASLQNDFDLSNIAEFFDSFVVGDVVSWGKN
jgi:hypothetical protein